MPQGRCERRVMLPHVSACRGRLEKAKEEASLEIDTRLEQRDRDLQQLQDQLAYAMGRSAGPRVLGPPGHVPP